MISTSALASSEGITGQSGKDGATCSTCHNGGAAAPVLEISGPTTLAPNATGQYTLIIKGGPANVGGMNIAVNNAAAVLQPGEGSKKIGSELTHKASTPFTNGELRFDFSLVAPASGSVKIFAAGNSANKDSYSTGDYAVATTQTVTVSDGTTPPPEPDTDEGKGCSATGGSPMLAFALAAATLTRLRRRRG
nr:MXAN_6652 family MXYO-CTERM-anchored protein [Cystobacter ferrugineus]